MANAADAMFRLASPAGAPATYGHLSFKLSRHEIEAYQQKAIEVYHRFLFLFNVTSRNHHHECLIGDISSCRPINFFNVVGNVTGHQVDAAELHDIAMLVKRTTMEINRMIFGTSGRTQRQLAELFLGVGELVNFGITIKNTADIAEFKGKLSSLQRQVEALIHVNDDIVRSQVRDHEAIQHLLNSTLT